ncbi:ferredoxin--NADP reductase [Pseudofulvimonas gallinarii]|jgi:ferredoxin--NADP+ reductase|uniref:ferredoxin--NADP(+) reductase n=1 Tax=Pseudofulvimonas gallinarii TaxID=634155 RepID=A0A4R3LC96_9GAMM|nr:ferredoxin--NADP reductase [Pseudofulvimonas gallinarii]TCS97563.1 ferredoxin--NADP+ reductase [Pseudofulvimonas gallinarii]
MSHQPDMSPAPLAAASGQPEGNPALRGFAVENVLEVRHWNDGLFSFKTTRDPGFRFRAGQFVMIGLEVEGKPLMRAYSIASPSWEEHLEFFSIKVPDGPLTSRLQHIQVGDRILMSRKPTGTLVLDDLNPGKRLFLLATGTGLAPFVCLAMEPETYERFEQVIVVHGVREVNDLAYRDLFERGLFEHEYLGELVRGKLLYHPTVTREAFHNTGRVTDLIESGELTARLGLPPLDPSTDRLMLCGSPQMLADTARLLDERGFQVSPRTREPGDYVIERAFVDK